MKTIETFVDRVITGDVLDVLREMPDNSIDITVTSPPYNKRSKINGWLINRQSYTNYNDHRPENEYQAWQQRVLDELYRVTKPTGSLFYNHKLRWEKGELLHPYRWVSKTEWLVRQEIVWDRIIAANMRGWRFWQIDERIYWLYKPENEHLVGKEIESKHAKFASVWRWKPVRRSDAHPAPFPLELPLRAIYSMVGDGEKIVLDPFCGIGTTLVAAKILGHRYIGIDISPDYAKKAEERIRNSHMEIEQAQKELEKHKINDSFADRKKRGTVNWPYKPQKTKK